MRKRYSSVDCACSGARALRPRYRALMCLCLLVALLAKAPVPAVGARSLRQRYRALMCLCLLVALLAGEGA